MKNRRMEVKLAAWDKSDLSTLLKTKFSFSMQWHSFLISYANKLGYRLDVDGICQGLANCASNAFWVTILTDENDTKGLHEYLERLLEICESDKNIKDSPPSFTKNANIFGFFDRVKLIQESQYYRSYQHHLLPKEQTITNPLEKMAIVESLVNSIEMTMPDGSPIYQVTIAKLISAYTKNELEKYLHYLSMCFGKYPFELILGNGNHVLSLCFCPTKKTWLLFDANHLPMKIFQEGEYEALAKQLNISLQGNALNTAFSTELRTANIFAEKMKTIINKIKNTWDWKSLNRINPLKPYYKNTNGFSLLQIAAQTNNLECIKTLMNIKVPINTTVDNNLTAIHIAALNGFAECLDTMLDNGGDVNALNNNGFTPIILTTNNGHLKCLEVLIKHGANINALSRDLHRNPLLIAARNGHIECLKKLIEAGANVNCQSRDNITPLYVAAQNGHADCVFELLLAGADIHIKTNEGETALQAAACKGKVECIELLTKAKKSAVQAMKI